MRYFCGTRNTGDTSNTANSSDASKSSPSVTRLSSYSDGTGCFSGGCPANFLSSSSSEIYDCWGLDFKSLDSSWLPA